jgi:hypothetical protein
MTTLADLIDAAERLQRLAADARAQCIAARVRLEELRHLDSVEHAQILTGLARLRAQLRTTEGRQ